MPNSYAAIGKRLALLAGLALLTATAARAQSGVTIGATGAPDASAVLDVRSTSQGLLPPRLTEAARLAMGTGSVPAPAAGLLVYQTDGTDPGYNYASSASTWVRLTDAATADNRYVQNQTAAAQAGGFRVSGSGQVGTTLTTGGAATIGGAATVGGAVTAGGSVQVPNTSAYTYSGAKSYSVMYGSSDFQTESYGANYPRNILFNGSTADEVYGYDANIVLRVPLHLPQGATLTNFTVYYYDATSSNLTVTLYAAAMNAAAATTNTILGMFTSSISSGYSSYTGPLTATIDNTTRAYFLRAQLPSTTGHSISGVRVSYTVSQAE